MNDLEVVVMTWGSWLIPTRHLACAGFSPNMDGMEFVKSFEFVNSTAIRQSVHELLTDFSLAFIDLIMRSCFVLLRRWTWFLVFWVFPLGLNIRFHR